MTQVIVHLFHKRRPATSDNTLHKSLTWWNSLTASYSQNTYGEGITKYCQSEQYQLAKQRSISFPNVAAAKTYRKNCLSWSLLKIVCPIAQGWGREADTSCSLQHNMFFITTFWTQNWKETILKHILVQSSQGKGCNSRLLLTFKPVMLHSHYCSECWIDTLLATHTRTRAHTRCVLHHVLHC